VAFFLLRRDAEGWAAFQAPNNTEVTYKALEIPDHHHDDYLRVKDNMEKELSS
jgi:hypothetical protein